MFDLTLFSDGTLTFDTSLDTSGVQKGIGGLGEVAKNALGVFAGNMMTKAVDGLKEIGSAALDSVSSLEQNVGGVETLFKDSANTVISNAENAYKTAGMSANEYMQTVTSFSASLLQSVGGDTAKAAAAADTAITDMSDNANKMGTDMQSIQNAYQGFAKQNYTMLDNLKLGYGGTKSEMERLLADASKLSGQKYDISNLNDVYSAIHVVQTELDITGTTAKEAATTLEGSMSSAKAAWDNFMNGSSDAQELADAFGTAAKNIVSNLAEIIPRLAGTIPALVGAVASQIPGLVTALVPALVGAVSDLLTRIQDFVTTVDWAGSAQKVVDGITAFIDGDGLSKFLEAAGNIIQGIATGLAQALPKLIPALVKLIAYIAISIIKFLPQLVTAGITLIKGLAQGFIAALPDIGIALLGIITEWLKFVANFYGQIGQFIAEVWAKFVEWGAGVIERVGSALSDMLNTAVSWLSQLPSTVWTWLVNTLTRLLQWGQNMVQNASTAMSNMLSTIISWVNQLPGRVWTWLVNTVTKVVTWGQNMVSNASTAMSNMLSTIISWVQQLPEKVWTWLSNTAAKVVTWGADLASKGASAAKGLFDAVVNGVKSLPDKMAEIGSNIVTGIWNGISSGWDWLKNKVSNLATSLLDAAKGALGIESPSREFAKGVGRWIPPGIDKGMKQSMPKTLKSMKQQAAKMVESMQASVRANAGDITLSAKAATGAAALATGGTIVNNDNHVEQTNTYNTPVATPSETAKAQREAVRKLVGGVQ